MEPYLDNSQIQLLMKLVENDIFEMEMLYSTNKEDLEKQAYYQALKQTLNFLENSHQLKRF